MEGKYEEKSFLRCLVNPLYQRKVPRLICFVVYLALSIVYLLQIIRNYLAMCSFVVQSREFFETKVVEFFTENGEVYIISKLHVPEMRYPLFAWKQKVI